MNMKICPECHKLSTDDDFCSNCGAAVFGADDVTDSRAIDCDRIDRGHDHGKVTYDVSERGTRIRPAVQNIPTAQDIQKAQDMRDLRNMINGPGAHNFNSPGRNAPITPQDRRRVTAVLVVVVIVTLIIVMSTIATVISSFMSALDW